MSCCEHYLKAYVLGEAPPGERKAVEAHTTSCAACGEELARLSYTCNALAALADEETPRRTAFVSDKVFEPGWWTRFWSSAPRLGFASAALLAGAIVAHGWMARPAVPPAAPRADVAAIERQVAARVDAAVKQAVTDSEARQSARVADAIAAVEKRLTLEHRTEMLTVESNFELLRKQMSRMYLASAERGGAE